MAWINGGAGSPIPNRIKQLIRRRQDNRCATINPHICTGTIDEFDHIINIKTLGINRRDANDPDMLQGLCTPCHRAKSRHEAVTAQNAWKRTPEKHPGLR